MRHFGDRYQILFMIAVGVALATFGSDAFGLATSGGLPELPDGQLQSVIAYQGGGMGAGLVCGGLLSLLLGPRSALLAVGALAAVGACLAAGAWNFLGLAAAAVALGLAVGSILPIAIAALPVWFGLWERGWTVGIVLAAIGAGGLGGGRLFTVADTAYSWRLAFLGFALLGAIWVLAWRGATVADPAEPPPRPTVRMILRQLRAMALPAGLAFAQSWGMALCRDYLPAVLLTTWHYNVKGDAASTALAMLCGSLVGGLAVDGLVVAGSSALWARRLVCSLGFVSGLGSLLMVGHGETEVSLALWLGAATFFFQMALVPIWAGVLDRGGDYPGIGAMLVGSFMALARLGSPMALVAASGLWETSMVVGIMLLILAAAGALALKIEPVVTEPDSVPEPEPDAPVDVRPRRPGLTV